MPQVANPTSLPGKMGKNKIPSGISRSSNVLRRTALHSVQELQSSTGTARESLQMARYIIESFFDSFSEASNAEQEHMEMVRAAILPTLIEIHNLLTWPDGWNGYDALAPKYEAVQYADHWIELFYQEVLASNQDWLEPNVTASAQGEVVFEWRLGKKGLTIYIGNQSAEYLKDWGADINTEMEDGSVNSPDLRISLWKWLMS